RVGDFPAAGGAAGAGEERVRRVEREIAAVDGPVGGGEQDGRRRWHGLEVRKGGIAAAGREGAGGPAARAAPADEGRARIGPGGQGDGRAEVHPHGAGARTIDAGGRG